MPIRKPLIIIISALILTALLAALYVYPHDEAVLRFLQRNRQYGGFHDSMHIFRLLGHGEGIGLLVLLAAAMGMRRVALRIFLALAIVVILIWPLKALTGRTRPNNRNDFSFPSGDSATISAVVAPLGAALPISVLPAVAVSVMTGGLRAYDNAHFPSDVCAGLAIGLLAGLLACFWDPLSVRLLRAVQPRHYAWILILISVAMLVPASMTARGRIILFSQLCLPAMTVALAIRYMRGSFVSCVPSCMCRAYRLTGVAAVATASVGIILVGAAWFMRMPVIRITVAGIGAGICLAGILMIRELARRDNVRACVVGVISLCALLFASCISLPLTYARYHYVVNKVAMGLSDIEILR